MGHEDVERIAALIKRVAANRTVLWSSTTCPSWSTIFRSHHRARARRDPGTGDYATVSANPAVVEAYLGADMLESRERLHRIHFDSAAPLLACASSTRVRRIAYPAWRPRSNVAPGEVVTLPAKRAGKTTTLKSIMGVVGRRAGSITFRRARDRRSRVEPDRAARHRRGAPKSAASSRARMSRRTCCWPPKVRDGGLSEAQITKLFPNLLERRKSQGTKLFWRRAADAGDRDESCAPARGCCSSTSRPRIGAGDRPADRPHDFQAQGAGFTILLVEQNSVSPHGGGPALRDGARSRSRHDP